MNEVHNENDSSIKLEQAIEKIQTYILEDSLFSQEVIKAKKIFGEKTGKIRESDVDNPNRINAFLFWFIFDWIIEECQKTPFRMFSLHFSAKLSFQEMEFYTQMVPHIHSIFEFQKRKGSKTIVKDIFTGELYQIPETDSLLGMNTGAFFETRIFFFRNSKCFANYFIQHPFEVRKGIARQIRLTKNRPSLKKEVILLLHQYHTKWETYRNMDIRYIYHFDNKLPLAK